MSPRRNYDSFGMDWGTAPAPVMPVSGERRRAGASLIMAAIGILIGIGVGAGGGPPVILNLFGILGGLTSAVAAGAIGVACFRNGPDKPLRIAAAGLTVGALGGILEAHSGAAAGRFLLVAGEGLAAIVGLAAISFRRKGAWHPHITFLTIGCTLAIVAYGAAGPLAFPGTLRFAGLVLIVGTIIAAILNRRAIPEPEIMDVIQVDDPYANYTIDQRRIIGGIINFVGDNFSKQGWFAPRISNVLDSPAFTTYVLEIPRTINSAMIINRTNDIEMALRVLTNTVTILPGAEHGGVLIQLRKSDTERLRNKVWYDTVVSTAARMMAGRPFASAIGLDEFGRPVIVDLDGDEPHLLVAGESGSGKSYLLHVLLVQLLSKNKPADLQVAILDPKGTFGMRYRAVPHLFAPAILGIDSKEESAAAISLMKAVYEETLRRAEIFKDRGVSTLRDFRRRFPTERIPMLLLVVDEAADLGGSDNKALKEAYLTYAGHIARKGRSFGVLLVLGIQRPTAANIGPNIRGQLTQRIVLKLTDRNESAIAMNIEKDDRATKLGGKGDGYYLHSGSIRRFIGAFLPDEGDDERPDLSVENMVRDYVIARFGGPKTWPGVSGSGVPSTPSAVSPAPLANSTGISPTDLANSSPAEVTAPDPNAAIAAEHNAGCSDREWLIIRGVELALAAEADDFAAVPLSPAALAPFVARAAAARSYVGVEIGAEEIFTVLGRFFPERDGRPQRSRTFKLARFNVKRRLIGRFGAEVPSSAAPAAPVSAAPAAPVSAAPAAPAAPAPTRPAAPVAFSPVSGTPTSPIPSAGSITPVGPEGGRDRSADAARVQAVRERERRDL